MTTSLVAEVLATNNFGDTRDGSGMAGPIGLLLVLGLAAATIFLIRDMNVRLRRLPDRFTPPVPDAAPHQSPDGVQTPAAAEPSERQPTPDNRTTGDD